MDIEFVWQDDFNIGVDIIDKEHQRLFNIINKLFKFRAEDKDSQWTCQEGIKFFKGHMMKHFSEEEAYMQSIGYEGLAQHRRIHESFKENTLPALEQELERTNYADDAVEHFLGVCAGWLIGHTKTEDLAIVGKHIRKWENLLPHEEIKAMRKVIVQLVFNIFHLESQLISDAYNGEKFGRGVYYRLVYQNRQDHKTQEVLMVFEEKLLINTVGKILGIKTNKLDSMLINAARHTARQFVGRVMEHFPAMDKYELKEENLLSYDQFKRLIDKENLQVSLLFNTGGAGYFAFCINAPHLVEDGVGNPVLEESAMEEVDEYLKRRPQRIKKSAAEPLVVEEDIFAPEEPQKRRAKKHQKDVVESLLAENSGNKVEEYLKRRNEILEAENSRLKVLVVDDSMTVRQGIKKMLSADYEVALVESGLAAIRAITLDRPDLILLDYEMPVCDGRQTLEMLRSDQHFADIPVIFLTGRSDPESVRKVMVLKPAGYLLKYLKPEEIKKKIDDFFAERSRQAFA